MTEWNLNATVNSLPENAFSLGAIRKFENKSFPLDGIVIFGRDEGCCDYTLPWKYISRQHTKITVTDHGLEVRDMGSANGTYLNDKLITVDIAQSGDVISFDKVKLVVVGPNKAKSNPAKESIQATEREENSNHTMIRPANDPQKINLPSSKKASSRTPTSKQAPPRSSTANDMDKTSFAMTAKVKGKTVYLLKGMLFGFVVAALAIALSSSITS